MAEEWIEVTDHKSGATRRIELASARTAHGGADPRLFQGFLAAVRGEAEPLTTAAESLWSHRMAFAAHRAAEEGVVVRWEE